VPVPVAGKALPPVRPAPSRPPETCPVICPGCGREIALPVNEVGTMIECARCDTRFIAEQEIDRATHCVRCGGQLHNRVPCPVRQAHLCSEMCLRVHTRGCQSPASPSTAADPGGGPAGQSWNVPITCAVITACLIALACCGAILKLPGWEAHETAKAAAAADDPYAPDCAIIRDWLKQHYGEIEVVSWGRRTVTESREFGGHATLSVRFRVKGEKRTKTGFFVIGPWDNVESSTISD
jgi:hypothetical protein